MTYVPFSGTIGSDGAFANCFGHEDVVWLATKAESEHKKHQVKTPLAISQILDYTDQ